MRGTSARGSRNAPSHRATTTLAKQFPTTLTVVRAMSMNASTPRINATASTGSPNTTTAPDKITNAARGTPATPLLVSMSVSIKTSCRPNDNVRPPAWAANSAATARYNVLPSRLNEYPTGITNATIRRGTPSASMASMARGSAASDVDVENAISAGSRTARKNALSGTPVISATGTRTATQNTISATYSVSTS